VLLLLLLLLLVLLLLLLVVHKHYHLCCIDLGLHHLQILLLCGLLIGGMPTAVVHEETEFIRTLWIIMRRRSLVANILADETITTLFKNYVSLLISKMNGSRRLIDSHGLN
jgi:hypothetical protein